MAADYLNIESVLKRIACTHIGKLINWYATVLVCHVMLTCLECVPAVAAKLYVVTQWPHTGRLCPASAGRRHASPERTAKACPHFSQGIRTFSLSVKKVSECQIPLWSAATRSYTALMSFLRKDYWNCYCECTQPLIPTLVYLLCTPTPKSDPFKSDFTGSLPVF